MTILDQVNATPTPHKRLPWNKGKLTGARQPLRLKHVWSIRTKLQIECRARDLAMFKLAIDSKLRGCNLAHERPLCARSGHSITAHFANEPSPSDQAPPMQRAVNNQLSNGIALPNRSCIVQCRRKSRKIVALVPRERLEPPTSFS